MSFQGVDQLKPVRSHEPNADPAVDIAVTGSFGECIEAGFEWQGKSSDNKLVTDLDSQLKIVELVAGVKDGIMNGIIQIGIAVEQICSQAKPAFIGKIVPKIGLHREGEVFIAVRPAGFAWAGSGGKVEKIFG